MRLLAFVTPACTGCGACVPPCAPRAVTLETERPDGFGAKRAVVDAARCTGCGDCVPPCPHGAIGLRRRTAGGAARACVEPRAMGRGRTAPRESRRGPAR